MKVKGWSIHRVLMHCCGMRLKGVRMLVVAFCWCAWNSIFRMKIKWLRGFCAVGYTSEELKRKTNEIANVCASGNSFTNVMLLGVRMDNMATILLIC